MNDTNNDTLTIDGFMTKAPSTVNQGLRLADALDRMYSDNIRHLPVVDDDGKLVGIVSTRDIALAASIRGLDPESAPVSSAMTANPVHYPSDCPLAEVVLAMETRRAGSVVITDDDKPVGVFTTTDALRVLRSQLAGRPVTAAVSPTHIVEKEPEAAQSGRHPRHLRSSGASRYDGMVSWFLAKF